MGLNLLKKLAWVLAISVSAIAIYMRINGEGGEIITPPEIVDTVINGTTDPSAADLAEQYLEGRYGIDFKYEDKSGSSKEPTFYFSTSALGYEWVSVKTSKGADSTYYEDDYYESLFEPQLAKYLRRVLDAHFSNYVFHSAGLSGKSSSDSPLYDNVEAYVKDTSAWVTATIEVTEEYKDYIAQNMSALYAEFDKLFYSFSLEIYIVPEDSFAKYKAHELWELHEDGGAELVDIKIT